MKSSRYNHSNKQKRWRGGCERVHHLEAEQVVHSADDDVHCGRVSSLGPQEVLEIWQKEMLNLKMNPCFNASVFKSVPHLRCGPRREVVKSGTDLWWIRRSEAPWSLKENFLHKCGSKVLNHLFKTRNYNPLQNFSYPFCHISAECLIGILSDRATHKMFSSSV